MSGSKTSLINPKRVIAALRSPSAQPDYVWDGRDDNDRPASPAELKKALAASVKKRGRPAGSGTKSPTTLRIDRDVLDALRASGEGWQTRVNALLREAVNQGRL